MNLRKTTRLFFALDGALAIALLVILATPLLDLRDYSRPPSGGADWAAMTKGLEELYESGNQGEIANKSAFRTMRSVALVRKETGGLGDYTLTGQGQGKAYFLHNKSGELVSRSVGEEFEGYRITKIDENGVECEKDGERVILPL